MTIYTAIRINALLNAPSVLTIGSWLTRGDAIRTCAKIIVEEAERDEKCSALLRNDENHGDIPNAPLKSRKVMDYIIDELGGHGEYSMHNDVYGTVTYYVKENKLAH